MIRVLCTVLRSNLNLIFAKQCAVIVPTNCVCVCVWWKRVAVIDVLIFFLIRSHSSVLRPSNILRIRYVRELFAAFQIIPLLKISICHIIQSWWLFYRHKNSFSLKVLTFLEIFWTVHDLNNLILWRLENRVKKCPI